jgi:TPR repeat protein
MRLTLLSSVMLFAFMNTSFAFYDETESNLRFIKQEESDDEGSGTKRKGLEASEDSNEQSLKRGKVTALVSPTNESASKEVSEIERPPASMEVLEDKPVFLSALEWDNLKKAVLKRDAEALFKVANLLATGCHREDGTRVAPDPEKAVRAHAYGAYQERLLELQNLFKAAEEGEVDALFKVGDLYYNGFHQADGSWQEPNFDTAVYWNHKARDAAVAEADKKEEIKFQTLLKAARQGNVEAQFEVAENYQNSFYKANDRLREKDNVQAVEWYTKAANQGHLLSQVRLGYLYKKGWSDNSASEEEKPTHGKDLDKAVEWFSKAANQGYPQAQHGLAGMYKEGWLKADGSSQMPDLEKAIELYTKAAVQGAKYSMGKLVSVYDELGNLDKVLEWFTKLGWDDPEDYARLTWSTFIDLDKEQCETSYDHIHFSLQPHQQEKLDTMIGELGYWVGISKPSTEAKFKDVTPNSILNSSAEVLMEQLIRFKTHLMLFDQPAFLVTSLRPKSNVLERTSKDSFLSVFTIQGRLYMCLGYENNKAADDLVTTLSQMQSHPALDKIITGYSVLKEFAEDEESKQNAGLIVQAAEKMKADLKVISDEMNEQIQQHAPQRNKILQDKIGEGLSLK